MLAKLIAILILPLLLTGCTEQDPGTRPEGTAEATGQIELEQRLENCALLEVIGMSVDEIELVLGEPDEVTWYSGELFIWEDARALIGDGENISSQKDLYAGGREVVMLLLDSFGEIEIGASFEEAKVYFRQEAGEEVSVEHKPGPHSLEYKIEYIYGDYVFYLESDSKEGPIQSIQVWEAAQVLPPEVL